MILAIDIGNTMTGSDMNKFMNSIIDDESVKEWIAFVREYGVKLKGETIQQEEFTELASNSDLGLS